MRLSSRPAARDAASLDAPLSARLDRLESKVDRILTLLERHQIGARDQTEEALPMAIVTAIGGRVFTARELIAHAQVDLELQDALTAADVVTARDLGWFLRRVEGVTVGGVRLLRTNERQRDGFVWRAVVSDS